MGKRNRDEDDDRDDDVAPKKSKKKDGGSSDKAIAKADKDAEKDKDKVKEKDKDKEQGKDKEKVEQPVGPPKGTGPLVTHENFIKAARDFKTIADGEKLLGPGLPLV